MSPPTVTKADTSGRPKKTVSIATLHQPTSPYLRPPSPPGRRCRAAADEGGQGLGQSHPSPGLRPGSCEVVPDSQIGRQRFISLLFLLPPRRATAGKTTSTIRISPFLPQSGPNACAQRNETGSPETTSKTLSIATSHQPTLHLLLNGTAVGTAPISNNGAWSFNDTGTQGLRITIAILGHMGSFVSRANRDFCPTVLRLSDSVVTNTAHCYLCNII